jgi:hypothetical protein
MIVFILDIKYVHSTFVHSEITCLNTPGNTSNSSSDTMLTTTSGFDCQPATKPFHQNLR